MEEKDFDELGENIVVEFQDDKGNSYYYQQELVIPVNGQDYAVLIGQSEADENAFDDEDNVIIAKIVKDANGEDEYVDLTDEEFEAVQKAYNELCDAEELE